MLCTILEVQGESDGFFFLLGFAARGAQEHEPKWALGCRVPVRCPYVSLKGSFKGSFNIGSLQVQGLLRCRVGVVLRLGSMENVGLIGSELCLENIYKPSGAQWPNQQSLSASVSTLGSETLPC